MIIAIYIIITTLFYIITFIYNYSYYITSFLFNFIYFYIYCFIFKFIKYCTRNVIIFQSVSDLMIKIHSYSAKRLKHF